MLACTELIRISRSCRFLSNSLWASSKVTNLSLATFNLCSLSAIVLLNNSDSPCKAVSRSILVNKSCWTDVKFFLEKPSIDDLSLEHCSTSNLANSLRRASNVFCCPTSLACFCSATSRVLRASSISSLVGYISGLAANRGWSVEPQTGQGSLSTTKWTSSKARPSCIRCSNRSRCTFATCKVSSKDANIWPLSSISFCTLLISSSNSKYLCKSFSCPWITLASSKNLLLSRNCLRKPSKSASKLFTSSRCLAKASSLFLLSNSSKLLCNMNNSFFNTSNSLNFSACCWNWAKVVLLACILLARPSKSLYTSKHLASCWVASSTCSFASERACSKVFNTACFSIYCLYNSWVGAKELRNWTFSLRFTRSVSLAFTMSSFEVASARDCWAWLYKDHWFRSTLNCSTTVTASSRSTARASRWGTRFASNSRTCSMVTIGVAPSWGIDCINTVCLVRFSSIPAFASS